MHFCLLFSALIGVAFVAFKLLPALPKSTRHFTATSFIEGIGSTSDEPGKEPHDGIDLPDVETVRHDLLEAAGQQVGEKRDSSTEGGALRSVGLVGAKGSWPQPRLQVTSVKTESPNSWRIAITYSGGKSRADTLHRVNHLASRYAQQWKQRWAQAAHRQYEQLRLSVEQASVELQRAQTELATYLAESARREAASLVKRAMGLAVKPVVKPAVVPLPEVDITAPRMVDNVNWLQTQAKIEQLEQRYSQLVVERSSLHPAVLGTKWELEEKRKALRAIPRYLQVSSSSVQKKEANRRDSYMRGYQRASDKSLARKTFDSGRFLPRNDADLDLANSEQLAEPADQERGKTVLDPAQTAAEDVANQSNPTAETIRSLWYRVVEAEQTYEGFVKLQREAWQRELSLPRLEVRLAQEVQKTEALPKKSSRRLLLALLLAFGTTAGIAMVTFAMGGDSVLSTIEQAHLQLPVPVVGVLPKLENEHEPSDMSRLDPLRRWVQIAGGLTLVVSCIVFLFAQR